MSSQELRALSELHQIDLNVIIDGELVFRLSNINPNLERVWDDFAVGAKTMIERELAVYESTNGGLDDKNTITQRHLVPAMLGTIQEIDGRKYKVIENDECIMVTSELVESTNGGRS